MGQREEIRVNLSLKPEDGAIYDQLEATPLRTRARLVRALAHAGLTGERDARLLSPLPPTPELPVAPAVKLDTSIMDGD